MSRELAVIVHPVNLDIGELYASTFEIPWGYKARVVHGTIDRYDPRSVVVLLRPTPGWARAAGEAWIRRARRREQRSNRREQRARRATGYEEKPHAL